MSLFSRNFVALLTLASAVLIAAPADAQEVFLIVIKDHRLIPAELQVPAGQKIKLLVDNQDPTPEEFESHSLNREKIIPGNTKATIYIGPLKPGTYEVFGEFHQETAQGKIIAK
ncbi:MAG: cupredoxin domain-containing protein [Betaproteobacteria bacterium]